MAARRLSADEAALWARVMAGVRPLEGSVAPVVDSHKNPPPPQSPAPAAQPAVRSEVRATPGRAAWKIANTLDAGWDRDLARGRVAPDTTVDLHGHTLASAHALLDTSLDRVVRRGDRVLLLITGKPPRAASERPHARGAIRAAVSDWLTGSRHAGSIAAVRGAHPRHGGPGALYIVLRRARETKKLTS